MKKILFISVVTSILIFGYELKKIRAASKDENNKQFIVKILQKQQESARYCEADEHFIKQSERLGVPRARWDAAEFAAATFPHAYKYTRYYQISRGLLGSGENVLSPELLAHTGALDLSKLYGRDIDGKLDLLTLLRDRVKNHSMVVLKGNKVVHQHFWNGMNESSSHLDMSVSKSFTSLMASIAVAEGKLDMQKLVVSYLPFLKSSAFDGVTVQEVADMRSGLLIPTAEFMSWDPRMTQSQEWNGENECDLNGVKEYLKLIKDRKYHNGEAYQYQDPNSEVLGMVVEAVTSQRLPNYMQQKLWKQLGVENDAYWMADATGFVVASGGLNMTTRDLARVGRMILNDGKNYLGEQIISSDFINDLWAGNALVRKAWSYSKESHLAPNGWYKDQFRILMINDHIILCMVGIHGQVLAMDKATDTVIAMNGGYGQTETDRMSILLFMEVIPAILDASKDL